MDVVLHAPIFEHWPDIFDGLTNDLGFYFWCATAQGCAVQGNILHHHYAHVDFGLIAALQTNGDHAAAFGESEHILFQIRPAHDIQNDIALVLELFSKILLFVVDQDICAVALAHVELFRRTGSHCNGCAECFSDLDSHEANTATTTVDQDGFAFAKAYLHHDIGPHGAGRFNDSCGFCEGETFWNGKQLSFRNSNVFGIAAAD